MIHFLAGLAFIGAATHLGGCGPFRMAHALRAGEKLRVNWSRVSFTPRDLAVGMNVEREHRNITHCSPTMSAKIALAHLYERPDYYKLLKRHVEGLGEADLLRRYSTASKDLDEEQIEMMQAVGNLRRLKRDEERAEHLDRPLTRDQEIKNAEIRADNCFRVKHWAQKMRDSYKDVRSVTSHPAWGQTIRDVEDCRGDHEMDCDEDQHILWGARENIDRAHDRIRYARGLYEQHGCPAVAGSATTIPTSILGLGTMRKS